MIARPEDGQLQWCFSTLGCADLSLREICDLAWDFQVPGVELRAIGGRLDLPQYTVEAGLSPAVIGEICRSRHTRLIVAGSSCKLTSASENDRKELIAFCAWADALKIPFVRVFGGGAWGERLTDSDFANAVQFIHWWRGEKRARQWQVEMLMETHDAFSASAPCLSLNERLDQPLNVIWDSHHTWRLGGESPAYTWDRLGPLVRHVHVKDSVDKPSARHPFTYVLPGEGQMPIAEVLALLRAQRFNGFVSLEWERLWHPYLPPLRDALNHIHALPCTKR
jgi:sugar phosphate isomerase/epimerase